MPEAPFVPEHGFTEGFFDLNSFPEQAVLQDKTTQVTLGDLHANAIKLVGFLLHVGAVILPQEVSGMSWWIGLRKAYQDINIPSNASDKTAPSNDENLARMKAGLASFRAHISQLKKNEHTQLNVLRLIGDEIADRGVSDACIHIVLCKLRHLGMYDTGDLQTEILLSNHGLVGLSAYFNDKVAMSEGKLEKQKFLACAAVEELGCDSASVGGMPQGRSLVHLSLLLNYGLIAVEEFDEWMFHYVKIIKLVSYAIEREGGDPSGRPYVVIFTHAPASLETIERLAAFYKIPYQAETIEALCATINQINFVFQKMLAQQDVRQVKDFIDQMKAPNAIGGDLAAHNRLVWGREYLWGKDKIALEVKRKLNAKHQRNYPFCMVHGHLGSRGVDDKRFICLDGSNLGKYAGEYEVTTGQLCFFQSSMPLEALLQMQQAGLSTLHKLERVSANFKRTGTIVVVDLADALLSMSSICDDMLTWMQRVVIDGTHQTFQSVLESYLNWALGCFGRKNEVSAFATTLIVICYLFPIVSEESRCKIPKTAWTGPKRLAAQQGEVLDERLNKAMGEIALIEYYRQFMIDRANAAWFMAWLCDTKTIVNGVMKVEWCFLPLKRIGDKPSHNLISEFMRFCLQHEEMFEASRIAAALCAMTRYWGVQATSESFQSLPATIKCLAEQIASHYLPESLSITQAEHGLRKVSAYEVDHVAVNESLQKIIINGGNSFRREIAFPCAEYLKLLTVFLQYMADSKTLLELFSADSLTEETFSNEMVKDIKLFLCSVNTARGSLFEVLAEEYGASVLSAQRASQSVLPPPPPQLNTSWSCAYPKQDCQGLTFWQPAAVSYSMCQPSSQQVQTSMPDEAEVWLSSQKSIWIYQWQSAFKVIDPAERMKILDLIVRPSDKGGSDFILNIQTNDLDLFWGFLVSNNIKCNLPVTNKARGGWIGGISKQQFEQALGLAYQSRCAPGASSSMS